MMQIHQAFLKFPRWKSYS